MVRSFRFQASSHNSPDLVADLLFGEVRILQHRDQEHAKQQ
jgi:hypothetical protein